MCSAGLASLMDRNDIDIELRDIDEDILDLLEDGRQTRQNLARLLDVTGEYVYQRVDLLIKLGVVEKIHDGFYELAESPARDRGHDKPAEIREQQDAYPAVELPMGLATEIERYAGELDRTETDHAQQRVAAARAVGRMLVAEDGVSRSEAQQRLLPQYRVPGQDDQTWWEKAAKRRYKEVDSVQWSQTRQQYELVE